MTSKWPPSTADLCALCRGSGSLFSSQNGKHEWWSCPACHGNGSRIQYCQRFVGGQHD